MSIPSFDPPRSTQYDTFRSGAWTKETMECNGFEELRTVLPGCQSKLPGQKFSEATILQKAIDHITLSDRQKAVLLEESNRLRREIMALRMSINQVQQQIALN
eukprot:Colp12_sorted_trinity150504_noHs@6407